MVSSLIPPKIAHPSMVAGGKGGEPSFLSYMYSRLPKGTKTLDERFANRPLQRWLQNPKYGSTPAVVFIGTMMVFGYTLHYQRHFKHHKQNHH